MQDIYIFRLLDTNGDGTGTKNAVGDYSGAVEDFYFEAKQKCEIHRMMVEVQDTGAFDAEDYGNGLALTNGIQILVYDAAQDTEIDLLDGETITTNAGWGLTCYDVSVKTWGVGDEVMLVRWTFAKSGKPLILEAGDKLIARFNDSLIGLVKHYYSIQGFYR